MKKNIKQHLSAATCALLSMSATTHAEIYDSDSKINASLLVYDETDRMSIVASQLSINKTIDESNTVNASIIIDSITGATPTGEVPFGSVQTVTSASGNTSTVSATSFPSIEVEDTRTALSGSWINQVSRLLALTGSANLSSENDYKSTGLSLSASLDTEDKLTTYSLAVSTTADDISRSSRVDNVAGIPTGMTNSSLLLREDTSSESRTTNDLVIGFTQVLTPRTLFQMNFTRSQSDGYHTDPYKLISIVDGNGVQVASYYEKRPDSRVRNSIYSQLIHNIDGDVLRLSYRRYQDDWNLTSDTLDLKYRIKLNKYYVEPHIRYYQQSAADFHRYYLNAADSPPDYASADSRLAEFTSYTLGVSSGYDFKNYQFSARLEHMSQQASPDRSNDPVNLQAFNLFNGVEAVIAQVNFSLFF